MPGLDILGLEPCIVKSTKKKDIMHNLLLIGTRLGLGGTVGHRGELSGFDLIFMSWVNRLCLFCLFFFFCP